MNGNLQSQTITRLTSGYRINQSSDDAAGLAVANRYRSDITELMQGVRNANDGLSTLQIVDGGLNNISGILDRLKTLATQAGSAGFTGSRATLNEEFTALLVEVDRQAANIGLGSGSDVKSSRNNTNLRVYIGGGSEATNSQVALDLSGTANLVNQTGLGLNGLSIDSTTTPVDLVAADLRAATTLLDGSGTQKFRFSTGTDSFEITIRGDADGLSGADVVSQMNTRLAGTGITAKIDSTDGRLKLASSGSFTVAVDAASAGTTQIRAAVADSAAIVNTGRFRMAGGTVADTTGAQVYTFTLEDGTALATVNVSSGATKDAVYAALRDGLAGKGIDVMRSGDSIYFQSAKDFRASVDDNTVGGLGSLPTTATSATNAVVSADVLAGALDSLSKINAGVTKLGSVQGKVGTAQNRLTYAIQLAQSQIANFSTAESRIRDADIAAEAANLTKAQVLQQAAMAAMAQANSAPQAILALLRN